jgi:Imidazolonepropionase and related amidohydrolases
MRTLFRRGRIFDGSGAPLADGDLVIEDGRIVAVGSGLDGDEAIECEGKSLLPGLFDCHIHLMGRYEDDEITVTHRPFSYAFYLAPANLRTPSRSGSPRCATPAAPTLG